MPSVNPINDDASEIPLTPVAANATPDAAVAAQTTFGMRRVAASTTAALHIPAQSTESTIALELGSNGPPEHGRDLIRQQAHGGQREDGDKRSEQAVLEQVLSLLARDNSND
jgi:hypothetical protein